MKIEIAKNKGSTGNGNTFNINDKIKFKKMATDKTHLFFKNLNFDTTIAMARYNTNKQDGNVSKNEEKILTLLIMEVYVKKNNICVYSTYHFL